MTDLNISIVQTDIHWENIDHNLSELSALLSEYHVRSDVVVLPEMFTTGFSMNAKNLASDHKEKTLTWMRETALKLDAAVTGSFVVNDNGAYYNRLHWVNPGGSVQWYDKGHLFRFEGEDRHFKTNHQRVIIAYKGWRFLPQVCYDLRFPVWSRNRLVNGLFEYDCLINVANWPAVRRHHWQTLLTARAIENQAYVAGVNRVGKDGNNLSYCGDSKVIGPAGEVQAAFNEGEEGIVTSTLSWVELQLYRDQFRVSLDWDGFELST